MALVASLMCLIVFQHFPIATLCLAVAGHILLSLFGHGSPGACLLSLGLEGGYIFSLLLLSFDLIFSCTFLLFQLFLFVFHPFLLLQSNPWLSLQVQKRFYIHVNKICPCVLKVCVREHCYQISISEHLGFQLMERGGVLPVDE